MPVLLISSNSLLREVLAETLARAGVGLLQAEPPLSPAALRSAQPHVIVVDSGLTPAILASLLEAAPALPCCRVIQVHASNNDLLVLDVHCRSVERATDLVEAVQEGITQARRYRDTRKD